MAFGRANAKQGTGNGSKRRRTKKGILGEKLVHSDRQEATGDSLRNSHCQAHKINTPVRSIDATCCPLVPPRPQSMPHTPEPPCWSDSLALRVPSTALHTSTCPVELEAPKMYAPSGLKQARDHPYDVTRSASRNAKRAVPVRTSTTFKLESIEFVKTCGPTDDEPPPPATVGWNCTEVMAPSCIAAQPEEQELSKKKYIASPTSTVGLPSILQDHDAGGRTYRKCRPFDRPIADPRISSLQ